MSVTNDNARKNNVTYVRNRSVDLIMRNEVIQKIIDEKVVAIVRGIYGEDCLNLAKALCKGGVKLMEVTFDQKSAEERQRTVDTIRLLTENLGDVMGFGAGTVTTVEMVRQAKEAGAQFIISPEFTPATAPMSPLCVIVKKESFIPRSFTPPPRPIFAINPTAISSPTQ